MTSYQKFKKIESQIKVLTKQELTRIEDVLREMDINVEMAFKYYKLIRGIEGHKNANVRVMRAINIRMVGFYP